jgi:hypothetical protein
VDFCSLGWFTGSAASEAAKAYDIYSFCSVDRHGESSVLEAGSAASEADLKGFQRDLQSLRALADLAPWLQDRLVLVVVLFIVAISTNHLSVLTS